MSVNSPFLIFFLFTASALLSVGQATIEDGESEKIGSRALLSLKETPHGGNGTFECSPDGPCVPCVSSEKKNEKYRCSETGYRIPLKCVAIKQVSDAAKTTNGPKKSRSMLQESHKVAESNSVEELGPNLNKRSLVDDSSSEDNGREAYITYRSCIPSANGEKLSVIGFEVIMLCMLLISGYFVYMRKQQTTTMSGFSRIQSNARF